MLSEDRVRCGSVSLNVAVGPRHGSSLAFLHGLGRRWQDFLPILSGFAIHRSVMAADLPGHGRSDRLESMYHLGAHVEAVSVWVRSIPGPPIALFGHSLGALVALGVAATTPERVSAIILEDPPSPSFLARLSTTAYRPLFEAMKRVAGAQEPIAELSRRFGETMLPSANGPMVPLHRLRDPVSLRFSAACLQLIDPEVFTPPLEGRWLDGIAPVEELVGRVTCPVLLLAADESLGGMFPAEDARRWADVMPDACLIEFPGVGHLIHVTEPAAVVRHTWAFLESIRV